MNLVPEVGYVYISICSSSPIYVTVLTNLVTIIGVIYRGTRGTGTPTFRTGVPYTPLFRTQVKNLLSTAVNI